MKSTKLTNTEVIRLFHLGIYEADLEAGVIKKNGRPIYTFIDAREHRNQLRKTGTAPPSYLWCRLYYKGRKRNISVAQAVWMAGSGVPIPNGFEIHHRDKDVQNNSWHNLFCLLDRDHDKLHNSSLLEEEETCTPF
jgi:hypothetical protein